MLKLIHSSYNIYPESDGNDEGTGDNTSECLVTSNIESVRFDGVVECTVWDEEKHQWGHDALSNRPREHSLVEQFIIVARCVQLRISDRVRLVHILYVAQLTVTE